MTAQKGHSGKATKATPEQKPDISAIALEVRGGKWGKGQERRTRLSEAGYNVRKLKPKLFGSLIVSHRR